MGSRHDPQALFTEPLPPLGEALETIGLSRHGEWLAPNGFDFAGWRTDSYQRLVMSRYDLSDDEALAVIATVTMYEQVAEMFDAVRAAEEAGDDTAAASITADLAAAVESSGSTTEGDADYRDALRSVVPLLTEPAVAGVTLPVKVIVLPALADRVLGVSVTAWRTVTVETADVAGHQPIAPAGYDTR